MYLLKKAMRPLLAPLSLILIIALWEIVIRTGNVSPLIMAPPSAIAEALWIELTQGTLLANLLITLQETAAGFLIAAILGIGLGSLISEIDWVRRVVLPYLIALQTVPKIAIAPLLVLWFGFGMTSKIIIAAMVAIFPILVNTIEGLGGTDRNRIDMVVAACGSRWQVFRIVKLPSALPFIFAGLNAGIVLALLGAVVGEFIGAHAGVGNLIMTANFRMDIATMFAVLVVLGVVGFGLHLILAALQRRVVFWQKPIRLIDE